MRMEMFLRALLKRDFSRAKAHAEKLQKMAGKEEWGKGYARAVNGILNAIKDSDPDALVVRLLASHDRKMAEELLTRFEEVLSQEFRDDYERGYYTAWTEFLRAYLNQKTLA